MSCYVANLAAREGIELLQANYVGFAAGVMAIISLALPWWTMTMSQRWMPELFSGGISIYLHKVETSGMVQPETVALNLWFCWPTLTLVFSAGIVALTGSMFARKTGRNVLVSAGILASLSLAIFTVGLHSELSKAPPTHNSPQVGLFSSGSFTWMETIRYVDYLAYPTFGFWLALVSAIVTLVSSFMHPILRQCSLCEKEVFKSFECLRCKSRICVACAVDNNWKCPECKADLVQKTGSE